MAKAKTEKAEKKALTDAQRKKLEKRRDKIEEVLEHLDGDLDTMPFELSEWRESVKVCRGVLDVAPMLEAAKEYNARLKALLKDVKAVEKALRVKLNWIEEQLTDG